MACSNEKMYSTKVIVEYIPANIDQEHLIKEFGGFESVIIHWPLLDAKNRNKSDIAHLYFHEENSVQGLIGACVKENDEYFYNFSLQPNLENNKVKIQPWELSKAQHSFDLEAPIKLDYAVHISGIKFPMSAEIFGSLMKNKYNGLIHCRILLHRRHNYATDSAVVLFKDRENYKSALTDGVLQLTYKEQNFGITMKPYLSDGKLCDKCQERDAPFYCSHLDCLTYICLPCHKLIHGDVIEHVLFIYNVKTNRIVGE